MTMRVLKVGLWLETVAVSAAAYGRLPAVVPVHWGLDGEPDRWGSRWELLLLGPALVALVSGLQAALDRRDKERAADERGAQGAVLLLALGLVAFLHTVLLGHAAGWLRDLMQALTLGLSFAWVLMGNVMGRVRPNRTVGMRTPWVFRSPEVWRRTHRLAGGLMVLAGGLGLLGALGLPGPAALGLLVGLLLVSTLGPAAYSYVLWRREASAG